MPLTLNAHQPARTSQTFSRKQQAAPSPFDLIQGRDTVHFGQGDVLLELEKVSNQAGEELVAEKRKEFYRAVRNGDAGVANLALDEYEKVLEVTGVLQKDLPQNLLELHSLLASAVRTGDMKSAGKFLGRLKRWERYLREDKN
jgi:hypothetical protein